MKSIKTSKCRIFVLESLCISVILVLAAYLRLANSDVNPGWYSDEGTLINIAQNLLDGNSQYLAITQSTLMVARLPLFPFLLASLMHLFNGGIETLRTFTGLLGVLSVALLYGLVSDTQERNEKFLAPLSALMLAIYPQAILYSRLGFSYNLLTPLVLIACWSLWKYLKHEQPGWLLLASLAVGMGSITDLMMMVLVLPLLLVVLVHRWRDLVWSVPVILVPFGIYTSMMALKVPEAFWFDLSFTLSRMGQFHWLTQFPVALINSGALYIRDFWIPLGTIGLFFLTPIRFRRLILALYFLSLLALCRTTGLAGLAFYYFTPLIPFLAIGVASLIIHGTPWIVNTIRDGLGDVIRRIQSKYVAPEGWLWKRTLTLGSSLALFVVLIVPFIYSTVTQVFQVKGGFQTPIEPLLINAKDARMVARYVNYELKPGDLVIASPATAWLFVGNVTDFQQAIAFGGISTQHFPANIPKDRFAFDPSLSQARFVVIDKIWINWAALNMEEVSSMVQEVHTWPLVYKSGEIEVYENPGQKD